VGRTRATRLANLEAQREAATRAWLMQHTEEEVAARVDAEFGPGTWAWLCIESATMSLEEIERPGELWGRWERWREAQP
jgi:hypothetical protein